MAKAESMGTGDQTATAVADGDVESPEFGLPIQPDATPEAESDEAQDQPADASAGTGMTGPDDDTAPDGAGLREADYRRKTQALGEDRRAFEEQQRSFQTQQQEWLTQQQQNLQEMQAPQALSRLSQFEATTRQRMTDPNLSPEQRAALQSDLQGVQVVQVAVQEGIDAALAPIKEQLEALAPQVQQVGQQVTQLSQGQVSAQVEEANTQIAEASKLFGAEVWEAHRGLIGPMFLKDGGFSPPPNPDKPGETFTIAEVLSRISGKDLEAAKAAQNGNRTAKNVARKTAATQGTTSATEVPGGSLTREQAIAKMKGDDPSLT